MAESKEKLKDPFMGSINELKESHRLRDFKYYEADVKHEKIMRRNPAINSEAAKKARIKFW